MTDPKVIYLEPGEGAFDVGRVWCEDDVWADDEDFADDGPATKYVRADIAAAPKLLEALQNAAASLATLANNTSEAYTRDMALEWFQKARAAITFVTEGAQKP